MSRPARLALAPDTPDTPRIHDSLVSRVRAEFEEMPGLCLTLPQLQRLCSLAHQETLAVVTALVECGYLRLSARGFVRA